MKKQLLLLLTTILSLNCYSQIIYEKGYFIDNANQKINCLIKNIDWGNNPTKFTYKLSENSKTETANIESVKEFAIDNVSKYIRNIVNIDKSSENLDDLSTNRNPKFEKQELFLKVLIEGKSNLYEYVDGDLIRFFYTKENASIEQLVYKRYITSDSKIGQNNQFKNQLWNDLKCPKFEIKKVENLEYEKNDLIDFFTEYNECNGVEYVTPEKKQKRDLFNLSIRPRINSSSLSISNTSFYIRETNFDNKVLLGFGLEAEFIFPFNKNKWAVTVEPNYQNYKSEKLTNVNERIAEVNYSYIEIPLSLRHYFFLNNNSKIFINTSYITTLNSGSSTVQFRNIRSSTPSTSLNIKTKPNFGFGIGYKQNDRYSLELRYQNAKEVLGNHQVWSSEYKTLSIIFGYSLF